MIDSGTLLQGRFLIGDRIGTGGMGAVYRAVDQKFGTAVAVKETFYGDTELAEAFEREARLLNGLHHPILPHVSDHFTENGGHFLVMEYIEGEDLSEILNRGEVFAIDQVLDWGLEILDGVDYLHSQDPPVVHRDIKPNNLKLTPRGKIVLLDFGMAKETLANTAAAKSVFGYSKKYSPLEQIEGTGTDERSDIFSLGASLYHLLTGSPPADVLARASAIVSGKPDPLVPANALRADVSEPLARILSSALSLSPDKRFESARAMSSALQHVRGEAHQIEQTNSKVVPYPVGDSIETLPTPVTDSEWIEHEPALVGAGVGSYDTDPERESSTFRETAAVGVGNNRTQASPGFRGRINALSGRGLGRPTRSTLLFLVPILLLCLALVLFGTYRNSPTAENTSIVSEAAEAAEATVDETIPAIEADAPVDTDGEEALTSESQNEDDGDEADSANSQTAQPEGDVVSRDRRTAESRAEEVDDDRGPVTRKSTTAVRPPKQSQEKTQARKPASSRTKRVVEPAFEQPSVSSIEAIMTGIPYERRRRVTNENDIWIQDERRRRRMRRIMRQNQNRYPF